MILEKSKVIDDTNDKNESTEGCFHINGDRVVKVHKIKSHQDNIRAAHKNVELEDNFNFQVLVRFASGI